MELLLQQSNVDEGVENTQKVLEENTADSETSERYLFSEKTE